MPGNNVTQLLASITEWMREPDYAEDFSLADMVDWINRRPLAPMGQISAVLADHVVGWRTMDSAPKDGTTIIVYFRRHGPMTVRWTDADDNPSSKYAHWYVDDHKHGPYPVRGYSSGEDTHWQPLPIPPVSEGK